MKDKKIWTVGVKTQPSNWDIENGFVHSIFWGDSERGCFKSEEVLSGMGTLEELREYCEG
jgi:hypothetical protein